MIVCTKYFEIEISSSDVFEQDRTLTFKNLIVACISMNNFKMDKKQRQIGLFSASASHNEAIFLANIFICPRQHPCFHELVSTRNVCFISALRRLIEFADLLANRDIQSSLRNPKPLSLSEAPRNLSCT